MIRKHISCIVGARPNFMKIAPVLAEIARYPSLDARLVHTGQHFSPEMSDVFFHDLGMSQPNEWLGIPPGSQTEQTAGIMIALERLYLRMRPDLIVVVGDVTSTVAASLVAAKLQVPLAHIEAGLRSFDRRMPEEINRLVTDTLSDYLFVSEPSGMRNLCAEGVSPEKVFFVGNVMIDSLLRFRDQASQSDVLNRLGLQPKCYALVTLHRPSNVDDVLQLGRIMQLLREVSKDVTVVFPIHPRTRERMAAGDIDAGGLILTPPLGYLDFLQLMSNCRFALTDSGGIQEETTVLGVPCLTMRENTERPVTIEQGTNRLVGTDPEGVKCAIAETLSHNTVRGAVPELWDGQASARIADILNRKLTQ